MLAKAVVRIDVEFTLTCAAPLIRARIVVFDKITVRTDATVAVKLVGVGVGEVHTVEGASETRAPRRNEGDRSLAEMEYHVQSSTDVYLACESVYD
jgi:hypothetical protein